MDGIRRNVKARGALQGFELRHMERCGIPLSALIADEVGCCEAEVYRRVSAGEISAAVFEAAMGVYGMGVCDGDEDPV